MIARGFPHVFAMAAAALLLAACSGGGSGPLSPQAGAVPQGSGYVAQSAAAGGVGSLAQAAPPLPTAGLDLGLKVLPNLTAPIINDSGTFPGGAIIVGSNGGTGGTGVEGISGSGYGVLGLEQNTVAGTYFSGVFGKATGPSAYGVYGYSAKGTGVRGYSAVASAYGGYFSNGAVAGTALEAVASGGLAGVPGGDGVLGVSPNGVGVLGTTQFASGQGGSESGVEGDDNSTDKGNADSGVFGTSNYGLGVSGNSTNGWGVWGFSQNGTGLWGQTQSVATCINPSNPEFCPAARPALYLQAPGAGSNTGSTTRGMEIIANGGGTGGQSHNGDVMSLDAYGNMILAGDLVVDGTISWGGLASTTCDQSPGTCVTPQLSSGRSSPSRAVERVGEAQLVGGHAFVGLDPSLAKTMDPSKSYHVFVTPEGDCNGLYVTGKTSSGFTVRELHHGASSLAFDYRIVASARQVELPHPAGLPMAVPLRRPSVRER